ncbi:MAG TPA: hypothetical protein VF911_01625 [Thermoanaerobaculia bacterium]|jgi:hypothetical protein
MDCPKCGFPTLTGALECARCGVVFAKVTRAREAELIRPYVIEEERIGDGRIGPAEWKILGFGLAAAIVVYAIPFTRFVFSALVTLFHEIGHAVMGWLFGHVSLPAFDFVYGGGLTHYGVFRPSIAVAIALVFGYLGYLFRDNRKSLGLIAAIFLIWLFFITREWRRELLMAAGGHLGEFILAGIMFYKALSGTGWRSPEFERPLGAFVAFFVQIHSTLFAWRLTHDAAFLDWYREGKGGALMNDLESIALDLHIWLGWSTSIEGVARWLLVFSVLPTIVALIWHFERTRWHRVLRALRTVDA